MGRPDMEPRQTGQRPDQFRSGQDVWQSPTAAQRETGASHHTSVPPFVLEANNSVRFLDDRFNVRREGVLVQHRRSRKNKGGFRR